MADPMNNLLEELTQLWPDRIVLTCDSFFREAQEAREWSLFLWVEVGSKTSSGTTVYSEHHCNPKFLVEKAVKALRGNKLNYQQECEKFNRD